VKQRGCMNNLVWNSKRACYVGVWFDGTSFEVDGDCWAESVQDGIKELLWKHSEMSYEEAREVAEDAMLMPSMWTKDMAGVFVIEEEVEKTDKERLH
jgi:hypothetical protein